MPRATASLARDFKARVDEALDLAAAAEASSNFSHIRRLYVYEAAYLLMFSAWENFLEQALIRFLCGYRNAAGSFSRVGGAKSFRNLDDAYNHLLGGRRYLLWHNAQEAIDRCNTTLVAGPHASVLTSALADLKNFGVIRNHVAHRSGDTRSKFNAAALALVGQPISGGRAGRLLRMQTTDAATGAVCSWLSRITSDLSKYANQIAA